MILRLKHVIRTRSPRLYSYLTTYWSHLLKFKRAAGYHTVPTIIRWKINRIARSSNPIVVGPWLSETGFELLYWIPFLNWVRREFNLPKDRLIAVSRGGAGRWYKEVCGQYIDVLDHFTVEHFKERNEDRIKWFGGQKQFALSKFDNEILMCVSDVLHTDKFEVIHPSFMYRLFDLYWHGPHSADLVKQHAVYEQILYGRSRNTSIPLPEEYVAAKFYFSACFPDTAKNRNFASDLIRNIANERPVVILNTGIRVDDHLDVQLGEHKGIHNIKHLVTPSTNLDIQTEVVAKATAFLGTYGGFSYLAPILGVPSIAFHSNGNYLPVHLEIARRAFSNFKKGSLDVLDVRNCTQLDFISPYLQHTIPNLDGGKG